MKQILLSLLMVLILGVSANATVMTFEATGTNGSEPVWARATLTTGTNTVTILLENLQVNPKAAGSLVHSFQFALEGGLTGDTVISSSAAERTIANTSNPAIDGAAAPITGWNVDVDGSSIVLEVAGSKHHLIGPGLSGGNIYTQANGSIAGNKGHNPFYGLSASWVINVPGVTTDTRVTSTKFTFGSEGEYGVNGGCTEGCDPRQTGAVPEPSTWALMIGGIGLVAGGRLFKKTA